MPTTRDDIRRWLSEGNAEKHSHMLVVVDTYDYGDYPVHVARGSILNESIGKYSQNMQRVIECYSYNKDLESQILQQRTWEVD